MKKLRIGQISPINLPIPPKKYGGTEQIIYFLCEELTKMGHEVFLFATGDSKVNCHLFPIIKKSLWVTKPKENSPYYAYEMAYIGKMARKLKLDILHDHLGPWALTLNSQTKIPIIHTLHVPFKNKDRVWAYRKLNSKLVSISYAQRKPAPNLNYVANIYNGININEFPFNNNPENYYVWVGELSKRKGAYEAIKIAKMMNIRLILAGRIPSLEQPGEQKEDYLFFEKYIKNELNNKNIKYVGELRKKELAKIYAGAIAFLFPLQWEEPFGLTIVEAMACGTPVIAFKRGSVPEVISKETGFVVSPFTKDKKTNYKDFIKAIKNINKISREKCRKRVEEKFTREKMVSGYERLYYKILNRK